MNNLSQKSLSHLKYWIWAYLFLLLFEGALRKWFLPGLATPLLIIRDPIAIWVIFSVWRSGNMPRSSYVTTIMSIGTIGIGTALAFGHGNLFVALFGARILLIHFPFMIIMGSLLDKDDVIDVGKKCLLLSIPMAGLIGLQFYSPQSAWVNIGVGGDASGSGFSGALGFFRPSATFSFTNGTTLFFNLTAAFVVFFWMNPKGVSRLVLIGSTIAVMASIPLSISRGLFFSIAITVLFALVATVISGRYLGKIMVTIIFLFLGLAVLSQLTFFNTATEAFTSRLTNASEIEGGLQGTLADRYLGGLLNSLTESMSQPFFGQGLGMGTNAGAKLMTGNNAFLISEGEWGRLIGEMGPILGLIVIFIRLAFCFKLTVAGFKRIRKGDVLPWILLSFGLLVIPQGQWAQPTSLGFSTVIGGLIIASFKLHKSV